MRYVSVGRRFVAILLDGIISLLWLVPLGDFTTGPGTFRYSLTGIPFLASLALWMGYFALMEAYAGATVGKLAVGIRVVMQDGSRLDLRSAFVRNILRPVDAFPYIFPYLVGAVLVWSGPLRQRLGDRVAKTAVVRAGTEPPPSMPPPPPLATTPPG